MGNGQAFGLRQSISLLVPFCLLCGLTWLIVLQAHGVSRWWPKTVAPSVEIETVIVPSQTFKYRRSGQYQFHNVQVVAPLVQVTPSDQVEIMKYGVAARDFTLCIKAGACRHAKQSQSDLPDVPATGISFYDAQDYAQWLTEKTGEVWRLPTDLEWAHAAGTQFVDDAVEGERNESDPSALWLNAYTKNAELREAADPIVKAQGFYGENEYGVADMHSNVWEWTSTCYGRTTIDADGTVISAVENCGVRAVEGAHRAYISGFIRDPKSGGCSAGVPPDHLGFRLVKEAKADSWLHILIRLVWIR